MKKEDYKNQLIESISAKIDKLTIKQIRQLIAKYA